MGISILSLHRRMHSGVDRRNFDHVLCKTFIGRARCWGYTFTRHCLAWYGGPDFSVNEIGLGLEYRACVLALWANMLHLLLLACLQTFYISDRFPAIQVPVLILRVPIFCAWMFSGV